MPRNNRRKSWWPRVWRWVFRYNTKSAIHERKMDKVDCIKMKNTAPSMHWEWKDKRRTGRNCFLKHISDKGLVAKIHREFLKLNNKKTNNLIKKWTKDPNRHLMEKDIQLADKYMKRCSTLCFIKELQIKVTTRYHYTPVRITIIQHMTAPNVEQ